jgi:hypothetical protein
MQGWIKLHRKITAKGYYKRSEYVHLWVHILLNVNHKPKEFMWNNDMILIKEGQLLTGRKQLAKETGISQSTIERILKMLENEHQIEQQKTNKFRIITVINWKNYQLNYLSGQQNGQQMDNKRTTSGQQMDTNNNDNKDKNEKNDKIIVRDKPETALFNKSRNWFISFTKENINPNYDFSGAEGKNLKLLLSKIKKVGGETATAENLFMGFQYLCDKATKDNFISTKYSISMINNQWNNLTNEYKKGNNWNYVFGA